MQFLSNLKLMVFVFDKATLVRVSEICLGCLVAVISDMLVYLMKQIDLNSAFGFDEHRDKTWWPVSPFDYYICGYCITNSANLYLCLS